MPKPACASQTAGNVPTRSKLLKICSSGTNATCSGTTNKATTRMNSVSRPRNLMNVKAYAAKAATMIGMTVAGTATTIELRKAAPIPSSPSTSL